MIEQLAVPRETLTLSANLHLPDDFDTARPVPAVVLSTPGSSVKEQIGATYASRLAQRGFAALTFDPAYQGQSTGKPRDLEDPYRRGEDISYALDALTTIDGIDADRVGALGICAGGGYAVHTARTDHRIKALATVVATDLGALWRSAAFSPDGASAALDVLAEARTAQVAAGTLERVNWLPDTMEEAQALGVNDLDSLEAMRYYRTARGGHERSTNRRLSQSDSLLIGYDAFHLVDPLLTQPLQVIVGGRKGNTGQYETGIGLWEMAPNPVDLLVVEGAGHYEMYDEPRYVDQAIDRLDAFYATHL